MNDLVGYDEYGHLVLGGRFLLDDEERGTRLSCAIGEEDLYLQSVRGRGEQLRVDHSSPRLVLRTLTRAFLFDSLLFHKKVDITFAGVHCGRLHLETHITSPHFLIQQPVTSVQAKAEYSADGLDIMFAGMVSIPEHIPTKFPEGGKLPSKWPKSFNVHLEASWTTLPLLLGNAHYFLRWKSELFEQSKQPA